MNAPIAELRAEQVSAEDRRRIAEFIGENEDSPVSILLRRLMTATEVGIDVTMLSNDTEVTPNQAAELLKMSRPHLLTFMKRGLLPFHKVGTHNRIKMSDLLDFMNRREEGAAIVANALGNPPASAVELPALTPEQRQAFADLDF